MLRLTFANNNTSFRPGDQIAGTARWDCPEAPKHVEISLGWSTRGKGTEDSETVATVSVENPVTRGEHGFRFIAPGEPHSFSGKLISLIWSVELLIEPGDEIERVEIVIAPDAREIELPKLPKR
jgi:hypothetical protein